MVLRRGVRQRPLESLRTGYVAACVLLLAPTFCLAIVLGALLSRLGAKQPGESGPEDSGPSAKNSRRKKQL